MSVNSPVALIPSRERPPEVVTPPDAESVITSKAVDCNAQIDFSDYSIPVLILCSVAFVIGLIFCFFGEFGDI